jgi:predicted RND superfamily exporter protein
MRLDRLDAGLAGGRLDALDQDLRSSLPQQLTRLARGLEGRPFGRAELPAALALRWINGSGQELIEIVPAEDVNDNAAAARFVTAVRRIVPHATGLPVVYQEASATVVRSFQLALLYAFAMVTLLLVLFLRNFKDTLLVLVPILFSATVTAGMTVWLGLPLNFANIIALPLLVGVGVDSGIHMVHRMRTEPPGRGQLIQTSTSRAVLASGLTTIASFGNLAFSPHLGMSSMGQLLTIGMAVTLVATLVVLPALMRVRVAA